jgi:hypothetical protein
MESTLSTLSEIAANLMKRERGNEVVTLGIAELDAQGWDELMGFSALRGQPQMLENLAPSASHMTVLRLIQGGLA